MSVAGGAPLLAAAGYDPASAAPLALAAPRAQGTPPGALLFGAAVVLDVDGDEEDEMVVVGGAGAGSSPPLPAAQELVVLSDLDRDYAGLAAELPYLLAGIGAASAFLVLMGYVAWRVLQQQRKEAAAGGAAPSAAPPTGVEACAWSAAAPSARSRYSGSTRRRTIERAATISQMHT